MKRILVILFILITAHAAMRASVRIGPDSPPVALNVSIAGDPRSGSTLYGFYFYSDADGDPEGDSEFQWYYSNNSDGSSATPIPGATSASYKITDSRLGKYIGFSVKPVALTGSNYDTAYFAAVWAGPVVNDPPSASSVIITGSTNVNGAMLGSYVYSDTEGDTESGSAYKWYSSTLPGGPYLQIAGETGQVHIIGMSEQGKYFKFGVTPVAATGNNSYAEVLSPAFGPANSKPYADNVSVSGITEIGQTLTGNYSWHDADGDAEGTSLFKWYRETNLIPGANSKTYILTAEDVDMKIKFEVTPVSATGYPDTGTPVMSSYTAVVTDPSGSMPSATEVCISGTRAAGQELTGKYHYINTYKEKDSKFLWLRGNTIIQSGTTPDSKKYTLTAADIDREIRFAVIPKNSRSQTGDTAFSQTLAIFTLPRETFSVADPDIALSANPAGGIFWGDGVSDGKFSPSSVDYTLSPFTVNYQYTIDNPNTTCLQRASRQLTVTGITMYFESFRDIYCQNGGPDTVSVKNVPPGSPLKMFYSTNPDVIIASVDEQTVIIDPGKLRAGNKEDTLFFMAYEGLTLVKIYRPFVVDSVPEVSLLNLPAGSSYCSNMMPFPLYPSSPGGIFSGPVENGLLNPGLATGDTLVKYTYTTRLGCVSSVNVPITINPSPAVSFHLADSCISHSLDSTRFINTTVSADPVSSWIWEFYEAGGIATAAAVEPAFLYNTGGIHKVSLTASTVNNCRDKKDFFIDLGVKPVADFYWKSDCYHPGDSLKLFDATTSLSMIRSRSWNFFDGDSLHTVLNPVYPKKATGILPVELIVTTYYHGCSDTVTKQVLIRPTISLAADDYFENFENGTGGWMKDSQETNNWSFGKPDRTYINTSASGDNSWFTRYNLTGQKAETYSVVSPCFDFTSVQRPMISLKLWRRFDRNRDGAAIQYMTGDSGIWQYIGSLDDGINWYNSTLIRGRPGGDQLGWTSIIKDETWIDASHRLDELAGKKDVKLRIVYGSDGSSQDNDGIAFDDIHIVQRTRGVLLEHFTNNASAEASMATEEITKLAGRNPYDIINIQYHTNFPGTDPFYNDTRGDAGARILFYGLTRTPYSFIDGGTLKEYAGVFDFLTPGLDSNNLVKRSLVKPSFAVQINAAVNGGVLSVSGTVKALEDISYENVTLYIAVTEKRRDTGGSFSGALGETLFHNIFRKFIPDAGGISLKKVWSKDEVFTLTERSWIIEKIAGNADIEIIAFIQNNKTKEIYQAVSVTSFDIGVGTGKVFAAEEKNFSIYPNPATDWLSVLFSEPAAGGTEIMIYDFNGSLVRVYRPGTGVTEYIISNPGLKSGLYFVRCTVNGRSSGLKKLVVTGR